MAVIEEIGRLSTEAIEELITWAKGAKSFVSGHVPKFVKEVISLGFWSNLIFAVIKFIGSLSFFIVCRGMILSMLNSPINITFLFVCIAITCSGFLFAILCISAYHHLRIFIRVLVAPRVYFIEYMIEWRRNVSDSTAPPVRLR